MRLTFGIPFSGSLAENIFRHLLLDDAAVSPTLSHLRRYWTLSVSKCLSWKVWSKNSKMYLEIYIEIYIEISVSFRWCRWRGRRFRVDIVVISDTHIRIWTSSPTLTIRRTSEAAQGRTGSIHHRIPAGCQDIILVSVFE